ncbi:MAG: trigger factor [Candidatus Peribacteraceae bacterium]|nr:trigger factor [Candidatus Peribacteraceae bacterium]
MPQITPPKKLKQSQTQCTVTFTADESAKAEAKALEKLGEGVRIEGFRPGRAPAEMIRAKINPEQLNEETVRALLPGVFDAIMKEHKLLPIIPPKVDMTSREPLTLVLTFVEKPDVKVKGADKIRVKKTEITIEKKEIDRMTDYLRNQYRTTGPVDRPAKDGDELTLDFVGHLDGKEAEGTRATGYTIALGSKSLIPGFEEALAGMKKGDRKTFTLTFPEDYRAEHLKGKPVAFTATVHEVREVRLPEFTDAFVKEHHLGDSVKDLESKIEKTLREQQERDDKVRREKEVFDAIRAATQIDLAPELIAHEERMIFDEIARNLDEQKMSMDEWLKQTNRTVEKLQKELRDEGEKRLTLRFAIQWLIDDKKIEVSAQELDAAREMMLAGVEPGERAKAEVFYKEGGEGFAELQWRKRVEKLVEGMLAA